MDCKYKFLYVVTLLKPNGVLLFNPCNDRLKKKKDKADLSMEQLGLLLTGFVVRFFTPVSRFQTLDFSMQKVVPELAQKLCRNA